VGVTGLLRPDPRAGCDEGIPVDGGWLFIVGNPLNG
jgi:hypothetical protein